jgi:hypothetical protein
MVTNDCDTVGALGRHEALDFSENLWRGESMGISESIVDANTG